VTEGAQRALEAALIALAVLVALALTAHHYGLGYDEPVYMSRAQDARMWLSLLVRAPGEALGDGAITRYWHARDHQPGFVKLFGALTTGPASAILPVLGALRAGTLVLVAALVASIYLLVASVWGRAEALASAGALVAWGLAVNYFFASLPGTPKYTGCRLFLPVFPFIAIAAGVGIGWLGRIAGAWIAAHEAEEAQTTRRLAMALVLVVALVGPARVAGNFHPHELSYYNVFIGGLPGAAKAGMEVTYWGETYLDATLWLNRNAPRGTVAWIEPPGCESMMGVYRNLGILRSDIRTTTGPQALPAADFAIFQNKVTEFSDLARRLLAERDPLAVIPLHGVPLVYIFRIADEGASS